MRKWLVLREGQNSQGFIEPIRASSTGLVSPFCLPPLLPGATDETGFKVTG